MSIQSKRLLFKILAYFNLEPDIDNYDQIHDSIIKDVVFKGTNLWILIFAIIIASVGLNMNSTAVIIGAMLISPLMGPINGMGYSLATYDFELFRKALRNFSFAVLVSIISSTIYFTLSPISTAHSELLARTSPSIYDVLIALFGGLAGIVAISSKLKGNVIPGVAIATALMPPLCTAGYGIATLQFDFFFGAFYLFTINSVFIALSSVAVSQVLKFPIRTLVDDKQKKTVNQWISFTITLILVPSIYFGYNLVQKEKFNENANNFVNQVSFTGTNFLLKHKINAEERTVQLVYGGNELDADALNQILKIAEGFKLDSTQINITLGLSFEEFGKRTLTETDQLRSELGTINQMLGKKNMQLDSLLSHPLKAKVLLDELKPLFPEVISCAFNSFQRFSANREEAENMDVVIIGLDDKTNLSNSEKQKLEGWLEKRLSTNNLQVIYQNHPN